MVALPAQRAAVRSCRWQGKEDVVAVAGTAVVEIAPVDDNESAARRSGEVGAAHRVEVGEEFVDLAVVEDAVAGEVVGGADGLRIGEQRVEVGAPCA